MKSSSKAATPAAKPATAKAADTESKTAGSAAAHAPAAKKTSTKAVKATRARPLAPPQDPYDDDLPMEEFIVEARLLLISERGNYLRQAEELKAEADSLALEHEPGDVQFDEEGGEGGTSNVDRELDLVLSAQALAAIVEIDRALTKIDAGSYGNCEQCGKPIPQPRLLALPYAALCVACKSGGLGSRR